MLEPLLTSRCNHDVLAFRSMCAILRLISAFTRRVGALQVPIMIIIVMLLLLLLEMANDYVVCSDYKIGEDPFQLFSVCGVSTYITISSFDILGDNHLLTSQL